MELLKLEKLEKYNDVIISMNTLLEMNPNFMNGWKKKAEIEKKIGMEKEASLSLAKYNELKKIYETMTSTEVHTFTENKE